MSEEQLNAFLEKVKSDTELQEKLKAAASPEAAIEIAKEAGFLITAEDIQSMPLSNEELSDSELEGVAGGRPPGSGSWMGRCCSTAAAHCRETVDGACRSSQNMRCAG